MSDLQVSPLLNFLITDLGPDGNSLFESAAGLAKHIAAIEGGHYQGKQKSVGSLLTQVFRYEREIPQELRDETLDVIRLRLIGEEPTSVEKWIRLAERAFEEHRQVRENLLLDSSGVPEKLAAISKLPGNRFGITPIAGDARHSQTGKNLIRVIVDKLCLLDLTKKPTTRYTLCFPSERDAIDYWRALFRFITSKDSETDLALLDTKTASERLALIDEEEYLILYQVPYYLCLNPAIIYFPDTDKCVGFYLVYGNAGKLKATEMPPRYIELWKHLYSDVLREKFDPQARIRFSECRGMIEKGL